MGLEVGDSFNVFDYESQLQLLLLLDLTEHHLYSRLCIVTLVLYS